MREAEGHDRPGGWYQTGPCEYATDVVPLLSAMLNEALTSTIGQGKAVLHQLATHGIAGFGRMWWDRARSWRQDLIWLWAPSQENYCVSACDIADSIGCDVSYLQGIVLDRLGIEHLDVVEVIQDVDHGIRRLNRTVLVALPVRTYIQPRRRVIRAQGSP
jgi:hypothetical protein